MVISGLTLCLGVLGAATVAEDSGASSVSVDALSRLLAGESTELPTRDFPVAAEVELRSRFWERVFVEWDTTNVAIHDRENLDVVWGVVDETAFSNKKEASAYVKRQVASIERRLKRLERVGPRDDEDRVLLTLVGGKNSPKLKGAWQRVRTQRGIASNFMAGLQRAKPLLTKIRATLREHKVPTELAALPFVESSYNPRARSWAGAAGLWQLMPATARENGLKVTKGHDERMNVNRATQGAAKLLASNYRMLKSWPLAITGYNHGAYGVKRAANQIGSKRIEELIRRYDGRNWGFASKNFYAEFVAASRILKRAEYGLPLIPGRPPLEGTLKEASVFQPTREQFEGTPAHPIRGGHGQGLGAYVIAMRRLDLRPIREV